MNEFDIKATGWDKDPMHWDRSEAIAKEIIKLIPLNKEWTALEYGAGTGITSFLLKDYLKQITLMDNSSEMVKIMKQKIEDSGVNNMNTVNFDLEHTDYIDIKFDFIFTQMVLHHINDIDSIILRFSRLLNTGGFLAIADLYEEDGSFHGEGFTGHLGFNIETFSSIVKKHHFNDITHRTCYVINRKTDAEKTLQYKVFLLTASKGKLA